MGMTCPVSVVELASLYTVEVEFKAYDLFSTGRLSVFEDKLNVGNACIIKVEVTMIAMTNIPRRLFLSKLNFHISSIVFEFIVSIAQLDFNG